MTTRRLACGFLLFALLCCLPAAAASRLRVATFRADATPEPGEPLIWTTPVVKIEDPLWAKGVLIESGRTRVVLCAVDWCGIGGAAYELFRNTIAAAAKTSPDRVALQTVHQHTAPYIEGDAYRLLQALPSPPLMMTTAGLQRVADRIAAAVRDASARLEPFDAIGVSEVRVESVASARRITSEGKLVTRYSTSGRDPVMAALPEGSIDPTLRTITLVSANRPLVRLHYYATHPQTFCCDGRVSADFVGAARESVEKQDGVFQVYFTGGAGDVTVGKYNDASEQARKVLQARLETAMKAAIAATRVQPAAAFRWRTLRLKLPHKADVEALRRRLAQDPPLSPDEKYRTAIPLAFALRRHPLPASSLQLGNVWVVHLPGEPMLEFQRHAAALRPGSFVAFAGYGDISPGYLCTDRAFGEGGYEPTASNTGPGTEAPLRRAIRKLLGL